MRQITNAAGGTRTISTAYDADDDSTWLRVATIRPLAWTSLSVTRRLAWRREGAEFGVRVDGGGSDPALVATLLGSSDVQAVILEILGDPAVVSIFGTSMFAGSDGSLSVQYSERISEADDERIGRVLRLADALDRAAVDLQPPSPRALRWHQQRGYYALALVIAAAIPLPIGMALATFLPESPGTLPVLYWSTGVLCFVLPLGVGILGRRFLHGGAD